MQGLRSTPEPSQRLASADRESSEFAAPTLQIRKHSTTCPGANDVLREFNRDTRWVAVELLGMLVLAALVFVVLFPERHTLSVDLFEKASQHTSGSWRNLDAATFFRSTDLSATRSTNAVTSVTLPLVEPRSSESSSKESLGQGFSGGSIRPLALVLSPKTNHTGARVKRSEWSPHFVRAIRGKALYESYRSACHLGDAEVKKRLLELWHRTRHLSSAFTRASSNVVREFVRPNQFWPAY